MKRTMTPFQFALGLALAVPFSTSLAQGVQQSITEKRVDVVPLATGYRASKIVGADIHNSDKDKVGTIDDIIVSPQNQAPYAIVSVGGFLGLGNRLIAVPFKQISVVDKQLRMEGATKQSLRDMPEFHYAND